MHIIIGFSAHPVILYLMLLGGRGLVYIFNVIGATYSFIVHGTYTTQDLAYLDAEFKMFKIAYESIWFPHLPLEGINKIGAFFQNSFFSRDDAFDVFVYSLCVLIISLFLTAVIEVYFEIETDTVENSGLSFWYFLGLVISILCFYPAWIMVTFTPVTAIINVFGY